MATQRLYVTDGFEDPLHRPTIRIGSPSPRPGKLVATGTDPDPALLLDLVDAYNAKPELLGACRSALRALKDNLDPGPMDADAKAGLSAAIALAQGGAP